ncbi:hypothetical protein F4823DRAFT_408763 [Ustulina deusta]|nr:hypothetical protein F4823DRAFT_408763 [Ustulina deusta]
MPRKGCVSSVGSATSGRLRPRDSASNNTPHLMPAMPRRCMRSPSPSSPFSHWLCNESRPVSPQDSHNPSLKNGLYVIQNSMSCRPGHACQECVCADGRKYCPAAPVVCETVTSVAGLVGHLTSACQCQTSTRPGCIDMQKYDGDRKSSVHLFPALPKHPGAKSKVVPPPMEPIAVISGYYIYIPSLLSLLRLERSFPRREDCQWQTIWYTRISFSSVTR